MVAKHQLAGWHVRHTRVRSARDGTRWLVLIGGLARLTLALRGLVCHQDRRGLLRALPPGPGGGPGQAAGGGLLAWLLSPLGVPLSRISLLPPAQRHSGKPPPARPI